jgi:hypothetical protein
MRGLFMFVKRFSQEKRISLERDALLAAERCASRPGEMRFSLKKDAPVTNRAYKPPMNLCRHTGAVERQNNII